MIYIIDNGEELEHEIHFVDFNPLSEEEFLEIFAIYKKSNTLPFIIGKTKNIDWDPSSNVKLQNICEFLDYALVCDQELKIRPIFEKYFVCFKQFLEEALDYYKESLAIEKSYDESDGFYYSSSLVEREQGIVDSLSSFLENKK